jgi:hypothetical protein
LLRRGSLWWFGWLPGAPSYLGLWIIDSESVKSPFIMTHYYLFVVVALWSYFVTNQWCASFNIFFLAGYSNEYENGRCGQALSTALKLTPRKQNRSRQHSCRWKSQPGGCCLQHELPCHQLQSKLEIPYQSRLEIQSLYLFQWWIKKQYIC